jgi:thioesterase domain-containing protein
MSVDALTSSLAALQDVLDCMPAVRAMQIQLDGYADGVLRITAPLAANVNDKGNAFGGSLASVLTLSGWALVSLRLRWPATMPRSTWPTATCATLAPVYEDLHAHAEAAERPAGMPS